MVWQGANVPMLVVGLGLVLAALALPWLTAGLRTGRGLRAALGAVGAALGVAAVLAPGAAPVPPLTAEACVEALSRRMAERAGPAADAASAVPPDPDRRAIGLVSGSATGTYHHLADDLVARARERGVPLFNRETTGSQDNIRMLADPRENAAIGFAQSDLLSWLRARPDAQPRQQAAALRLVLPLHAEEVHVLARAEVGTLADLAGRRVVTAASSRGSGHTAENLLRRRGIRPASLDTRPSAAEALCSVLTGQADAVVAVAGKPTAQIASLAALADHPARPLAAVHLLALAPVADGEPEGYEPAELTPADYPWLAHPVPTLAVRALLMAFDFSPRANAYQRLRCQQIARLGALLREDLPRLQQPPHHPKWRDVDPARPVPGWAADRCARAGREAAP